MPKLMHISVAIELPADEWEEARQKVALHPLWTEFIGALNAAGIKFQNAIDTVETRTKPAATNGRTRKQRVSRATTPTLVPADPPAAA